MDSHIWIYICLTSLAMPETVLLEYTVYKDTNLANYSGGCCGSSTPCPEINYQNYYRYLEPSRLKPDMLYVGAMNYLLMINITSMECVRSKYLPPVDNTTRQRCTVQGKKEVPDCQNHIREAFEIDNTLEVCGTGAYTPMMYYLNIQDLGLNSTGDANSPPTCPYDPLDNNTLLYSESGNPGNAPAKFFGFFTDFIKNFPVFLRPRYTHNGVNYVDKLTDMEDVSWLNSPQFVGSFDISNSVMVFFRETAVEYAESNKKVYSRVGKVCKNDLGGGTPDLTKKRWLSFQKARLICSLPGLDPYYFDDIYDVAYDGNDNFYALFYKQGAGLHASAICVYSLADITISFKGPFMFKNLTEVKPDPNPRLDNCHLHDTNPDIFTDKTSRYQLMLKSVQPKSGKPIFYQHDVQLLRIALGQSTNDSHRNIYVGTSAGEVYDIFVNGQDWSTQLNSIRLPFGSAQRDKPIWKLWLPANKNFLLAATDYSITKIPLDTCSDVQANRLDECLYNTRCKICDKRCVLSTNCSGCGHCISYSDIRMGSNFRDEVLKRINFTLPSPPKALPTIKHTYIGLNISYPLRVSGVRWRKNNTDQILVDPEKYAFSENEIVIKSVTEKDGGIYFAEDSYNKKVAEWEVSIAGDDNESLIKAWKQSFTDWSTAFQEWKQCSKVYGGCNVNP